METNSKSSFKHKLIDFEAIEEIDNKHADDETRNNNCGISNKNTCSILPSLPPVYSLTHHETSPEIPNQKIERSLSSQVMKYYYKYSQNSNLNKYFSLPGPDIERYEYHWEDQEETSSKPWKNQKVSYDHKNITTCIEVPRERRNLTRPPLIGQPSRSTTENATTCNERMSFNVESPTETCVELNSQDEIKRDKNDGEKMMESVGLMTEFADRDIKIISPTSSVASHNRPLLEWDSWADVGYYNTLPSAKEKPTSILHAIEKVALIRNLDATSLRLDPEGTTATSLDSFNRNTRPDYSLSKSPHQFLKPNANSTRFIDDVSELTNEIKITPIVKSNAVGIITGNINDEGSSRSYFLSDKIGRPCDKLPFIGKKYKLMPISTSPDTNQGNPKCAIDQINESEALKTSPHNILKRNASMHELVMPLTAISLKRSQSELNLRGPINSNRKVSPIPFNFLSTSSITTIINRPATCDKNIQTNLNEENEQKRESNATQASSIMKLNQVKKRNPGEDFKHLQSEQLSQKKQIKSDVKETVALEETCNTKTKTLQPILKNNDSNSKNSVESKMEASEGNESFPSGSQEEADGGRASNSFEYFPGHIYQNVPQGESTSHASSINTERSHSTMPNTSSSLDEKLWGDSDSLLRDLERSLNILKSLVNTNKCDKQIKKRLIHHVIKRLVTARYTDDRIERNLEENVPWNPDNARNKIYCTEIIQALAKKHSHDSTEESIENWKLNRQAFLYNKKVLNHDAKFADMIHFASSEDSDAFEERTTDRTDGMQDGRKARLGLRSDDKYNHSRHHHKYQIKDRTTLDTDKSESSECFLPQSQSIKRKGKVINKISNSEMMKKASVSPTLPIRATTTPIADTMTVLSTTINNVTTSNVVASNTATKATVTVITSNDTTAFTSTSTTSQSSNNQSKNQSVINHKDIDWRLPATISERRFKYEKSAKLGTMSRLIDYVEMEKKNQLVWINNEINHLLNLKKLLEEPVKIKKHKEVDVQHEKLVNSDKKEKYQHVESNISKSNMLRDQWSSHGNIVAVCGKKDTTPKKKKSCFTQTTINDNTVKSVQNDETEEVFAERVLKVVSAFSTYTQTMNSNSEQSSTSVSRTSGQQQENRNTDCQCQDLRSHSQQIGTQMVNVPPKSRENDDQRPVITQLVVNSKKETKNILNDRCKSEFTVIENQEEFHDLKIHCRGCLCGQSKDKLSKMSKNEDRTEMSNMPGTFCICGIQRENASDRYRLKQTEENELRRKLETNEKAKNEDKFRKRPEGTRCKACGTFYAANRNHKCQCTQSYEKPIAYELSFQHKKDQKYNDEPVQLTDYLKKNKPEFVDNVEMRKRYMVEISQLRQMKKEKIMQLLALASPSDPIIKSKGSKRSTKPRRKISEEEMKMRLRLKYLRLNEVRSKRRQQEKSEQLRHNHLMAKIFCKKLQQKVLQGRVTLSQSVSVISNI